MAKIADFSPKLACEHMDLEAMETKDPSQIAVSIIEAAHTSLKEKTKGLDWLKFHLWYRVIEFNNVNLFQEVLSGCTEAEAHLLLTGNFVYPDPEYSVKKENGEYSGIQKPFMLAATFCSVEIFERVFPFISEDERTSTESKANNVIHILILGMTEAEKLNKEIDVEAYRSIYNSVMRNISHKGRLSLLMQVNEKGFRPLELAAHHGQMGLFMTIFKEEGIYRFSQQKQGILTTVLYDVTDYEAWTSASRTIMSPLRQIMAVHSKLKLADPSKHIHLNLMSEPVLVSWTQAKFKMNIPLIVLKFIFRTFLVITLAATVPGLAKVNPANLTGEGSHGICNNTLKSIPIQQFRIFYSSYGVLWAVWELGLISWGIYLIKVRKSHSFSCIMKPELNSEIFFHKSMVWIITIFIIFSLYSSLEFTSLKAMIHTIVGTTSVFSLTYIFQTVPVLGIYVICIIDMLMVLFSFLPFFIILFGCTSLSFMLTTLGLHICSKYFNDAMSAIYSMFRMMLNLLQPSDFDTSIATDVPTALCFLHILFVLLVPILLLNFLIGVMSNAINAVMAAGDIHFMLNRTQVAVAAETECSFLLRKIFAWRAKRFFLSKNGRLYIRCTEVEAFLGMGKF